MSHGIQSAGARERAGTRDSESDTDSARVYVCERAREQESERQEGREGGREGERRREGERERERESPADGGQMRAAGDATRPARCVCVCV
jgi:hypothetical protein